MAHKNAQSKSGRAMDHGAKNGRRIGQKLNSSKFRLKYFQPGDELFRMEIDSFKQISGSNVDDNVM